MAVSEGYPEKYKKGYVIEGIKDVKDAIVFHSGTIIDKNSKTITSGGRVLTITGLGENMEGALNKSYNGLEKIDFKGIYYRKDIGFDL